VRPHSLNPAVIFNKLQYYSIEYTLFVIMLTLQENSLNWALNHVLRRGYDIFQSFEYEAIHDWNNLRYFYHIKM
jgi:hypothetical protein